MLQTVPSALSRNSTELLLNKLYDVISAGNPSFLNIFVQRSPSPIKCLKQFCTSISIKINYQMVPSGSAVRRTCLFWSGRNSVCWFAAAPDWALVCCLLLHSASVQRKFGIFRRKAAPLSRQQYSWAAGSIAPQKQCSACSSVLFSAAKLAEKKLKEKLNPAVLIPPHVKTEAVVIGKLQGQAGRDGICPTKNPQVSSFQALFCLDSCY